MTATVNLTALAETRAKMTPGEYREWGESHQGVEINHRDGEGWIFTIATVRSFYQRHENAAGIVATHNAADVLIEVVRAAKAYISDGDDGRDRNLRKLRDALAKVTL